MNAFHSATSQMWSSYFFALNFSIFNFFQFVNISLANTKKQYLNLILVTVKIMIFFSDVKGNISSALVLTIKLAYALRDILSCWEYSPLSHLTVSSFIYEGKKYTLPFNFNGENYKIVFLKSINMIILNNKFLTIEPSLCCWNKLLDDSVLFLMECWHLFTYIIWYLYQ